MSNLRILDLGPGGAFWSQALWHGLASAAGPVTSPTLSFCRPTEPYVGLGYHRSAAELDLEACRSLGLPIVRRRIGGGPVYLDSDQLFFQLTLPHSKAPARVDRLYDALLDPAVAAFRRLGLEARRRGLNDLAVGDRKISGTGAGQIGGGVTVVGNLLLRFPHRRMAAVLALPSDRARSEVLRLMRRYVTSAADQGITVLPDALTATLAEAVAKQLGLSASAGRLTAREEDEVERWETRFAQARWREHGSEGKPGNGLRTKISTDARVFTSLDPDRELVASLVGGRIDRIHLRSPALNGAGASIQEALEGLPLERTALAKALLPFGSSGSTTFEWLATALDLEKETP